MKPLLTLATRYIRAAAVNYKTTIVGVAMVLHALYAIASHAASITDGSAILDIEQLTLAKAELLAGVGFISSRDADRSSQDSGLRK